MNARKFKEFIGIGALISCIAVCILFLGAFLFMIFREGTEVFIKTKIKNLPVAGVKFDSMRLKNRIKIGSQMYSILVKRGVAEKGLVRRGVARDIILEKEGVKILEVFEGRIDRGIIADAYVDGISAADLRKLWPVQEMLDARMKAWAAKKKKALNGKSKITEKQKAQMAETEKALLTKNTEDIAAVVEARDMTFTALKTTCVIQAKIKRVRLDSTDADYRHYRTALTYMKQVLKETAPVRLTETCLAEFEREFLSLVKQRIRKDRQKINEAIFQTMKMAFNDDGIRITAGRHSIQLSLDITDSRVLFDGGFFSDADAAGANILDVPYTEKNKDGRVLSPYFIYALPRDKMSEGGIFPAIVGTFYLVILSTIAAMVIGVLAAIWLSEYAKPGVIRTVIRLAINTLAGVPSIVFGLFGMTVFVIWFGWGVSILAGAMTLAILILPIIINTAEEAIKAVPQEFRESAYGIGATKRQTIMKIVLPAALPSILTGTIISIGRAAGETAPILFTAAAFSTPHLPRSLRDEVMAMPYHIYVMMTEGTFNQQKQIAYGTAIILLLLVFAINITAIVLRYRIRRKKKW